MASKTTAVYLMVRLEELKPEDGGSYERPLAEQKEACLRYLKEAGHAILVIDKHVRALCDVVDRHYIIERGRSVWSGTSEQLVAAPDLQHRYLGI